jgi:NitT/TauT family transport system ATP-binding protein
MSLLRAHEVGKSFRQPDGRALPILDTISLELKAGEIVALLGASGSGKTTFLRILCGEEKPDRGAVESAVARPGPQFGYLSQHDRLLPWRTALANVALGPELLGKNKAAARQLALEALAAVGLGHFADNRPAQLSGGMQQRVLLARMLALKPKLLLLDEPMSSLDVLARRELAILIKDYTRAQQAATLVVTHSVEEACGLADRILLVTRSPARLFKEIRISDTGEGLARDKALDVVMHGLWAALGVAA